ncbi:DnaJ subfamily C member 13 [Thelohanellus kitauei]|uniref:DnaJ subfamily C member 13 n=1 Tax=Thelohanellus kitauei TaxID=669202 RepID=A0A0C2MIP5_THEKT|nr:DnaJ subfamily C member 13 [Thelohanellus kitauei]
MDDIQSMILLYESQQENPELLWNTETRDTVSTYISNLKNKVFEKQQEDPNSTYDISKDFVDNINQEDSLMIANVSVHRFIAQPSWVLRHSREFLCGLFDKIYPTYTTKKLIDISEDMETLTTAICLFLQYNPVQCDQLPSLGHISKMIGFLDKSSTGSSVAKSTLRILNSCSNTRSCILDIYKNERWLFAVLESFEKRPDCAMLGASIINNCFSQEVSLVSTYILQNDFIPKLVRVLNYPLQEIERPLEAKAFIVNGLQALEKDLTHGKRITQLLNDFPEWKQYRFQKHDLFIDQSDTQHLLMQNTAGLKTQILFHTPVCRQSK